jgi:hypothetical protein
MYVCTSVSYKNIIESVPSALFDEECDTITGVQSAFRFFVNFLPRWTPGADVIKWRQERLENARAELRLPKTFRISIYVGKRLC